VNVRNSSRGGRSFTWTGLVTFFGTPKKPEDLKATVYSEVCLSCHRNMLRISEIAERDLPGPLKKAGLIMAHRKHMEAFQKRGKGEGCTTCHATVVHAKPYKGYKIVIPRGHIRLDEIPKAEQASIETSIPGASTPPTYSPAEETTSKFVEVPKSTTIEGAP